MDDSPKKSMLVDKKVQGGASYLIQVQQPLLSVCKQKGKTSNPSQQGDLKLVIQIQDAISTRRFWIC